MRDEFAMKNLIILITTSLLLFITTANGDIQKNIEHKIKQIDPNLNIGVKITNLDKKRVVFEKNADRYFMPASTLKFISLISLLEHFGSDYKFTSKLFEYNGNYYIALAAESCDIEIYTYYCISPISPIGKLLLGKKVNEHIKFNTKISTITEIL